MKSTGNSTAAAAATFRAASSTTTTTSVECAMRCAQLLRALLLAVMLHQNHPRRLLQQQQQEEEPPQHSTSQKKSPLTSVLGLFEDAAYALDVLAPLAAPSAPSLVSSPAGEICQPGERLASPPPSSSCVEAHSAVDDYTRLAAQAQASLHLSRYQRRILRDGDGHEAVALREYFEEDDMNEALSYTDEVWSPLPSSMSLFKVAAVLVEKVAAALCPAVDESPSSNHTVSNNNSFAPPSPSCAALLLQPIATDAGSFFLRCGEALRAQWQQQRSRRLLQQVGHNEVAATGAEDTSAETAAAAVVASRDPFRAQEELEAREESHYATIVWCVLSFLWHSSSSGAPQLDERGVAAVTRRASNGFLQLLPSATAERGGTMATTMTGGPRMAPVQLSRLLAHGATVRRLLELTRSHLQAHVESLLRHASALVTVASPYGSSSYLRGYHGHTYPSKNPSSSTAAAAQQRQATTASTCRALVAARDGLTELTHVWVTVRWHLSRLHAHHADYTARHVDLETLQQRHDQQQIYGRPTAKELRILRTLEQDAPLLPTTAKDEEVRLKRWVKDQQHTAAGTALATSAQLLEALVCAALVPLNTADPSAQQKLVDEAVRALTDVEMITGTEATHRPGSGGGSSSTGRNTTAQQQQQQQAPRCTQEAFVIYTPILLWCYLAEACSRCGTAEQTALVRGVLDRYLLTESPEVSNADTADAVLTTAPFVQKLLLRPQWAVLEDCSLTTRMAFCRALSALASRSTPASSSAAAASSSSTSALGSLQSAYRLLLALQIQQLPEPSAAAATALRAAHHAANKTKKNDTAGVGLGNTDSVQRHGPSSKLTLSSAQQLLSAITEYLTRSADTAASRDGSPAAALLLPLLVELCNVLLHLPASSPQWADGDVQLFALRVVVLFKQQQMALLTASPSPLTVGTANATATASASASAAAVAAAAAAAVMMDAFLQLLWTTFAHVWNGVFRNPNSRQRRFLHTSAAVTLWARRVFDHHRRHTLLCAAAVQDDDSGERGNGGNSPASSRPGRSPRRKRDNSNHTTGTDGALLSDTVSPLTPATVDPNANPLYFAGVAYLPGEDDGSYPHHDEERPGVGGGTPVPVAGGVSEGESVERHRASPQRPRTGGPGSPNNTNARGGAAFFSTVFLHAHMPCEFMELLEDILFHLPSLWTYILAPPGTVAVPAVSAALNRSASPTAASEHDGVSRMQTQYDFVCHAALQAAQALRELQHFANSGNEPAAGERRGSATGTPTTGGQLCGLRPIYIEIVAALQQYGVAMRNSNSAASGGGAQQQGGHNTSSAAAAAAAATASGARGGGNARSGNSSVNTPAVSSACHGLMETLNKYNEDPNYAKLAVHVVREMLALCNDDTQSISMGGAALSNAAAAGGGGGGGGGSSASGSSGSNSRKKNPSAGGGAAAGGAEGSNSISGGVGGAVSGKMSACVSAAAVTMDVRHVIRSVRAQVHEHHCAIRAFLASVDAETEAWLTRGGFNLAGQVQQQQQQQHEQKGPQQGTQGSGPSPPASPSAATAASPTAADAGSAKAAAASTSRKKTNRKGNKKRAGGRSKKADVRGNDDDDTDDDEANRTGEAAPSTGLPYTEVTRDFSFVEEQKLKQLTCGVARWRRSRAGRTLRQRYVQFNTPYVAQLHLIEAALLHMGATAQHDAAKQKRILQELLARTDGAGGDAPTAHAAAAAAGGAGTSPSSLRLSPRDTKKSSVAPPPTSSCDDADTESPTQVTEDLLRHCVCASNLFQHLWLPARASAAVQLAVSHLQEAPLPLAPSSPALAALVSQLLVTPLFAIAAVQQGYCDARRDVHNCVLQPPVIKVGAAVSWSRRNDLLCTAPSLFTLTSVAGKRGEQKMARRAGVQARQQRRFHLLQLCWCVEAEAETRAEATRDELQERVRILQVAQQLLLPLPEQSTSLKALLASAAELLARVSEKGKRTGRLVNSARQTWAGKNPVSTAAHPTREAAHTGAVDTLPYSPFEGMGGGSTGAHGGSNASTRPPAIEADTTTRKGKGSEGTSSSSSLTSVDAAAYGRDMTEADLVHQLIALAHALEQASPATSAAAYRTAQQLTNGRYATELLPRLMQLEENDEGCEPEVRGATVLAYEKGLRSVSDGVWLLRSARSVRRQWSTSPVLPNAAVNRAGPSTQSSTSTSGAVSWKAAMEAYQRAAQALRAAGRLHLLGECLYEQGCLYCAAGRLKEAERNWMDALDCLLSTPHVFDDWHTQRIVPPPLIASSSSSSSSASTSHRGVEELVWMVAALTSLAEHAYATDASRAMAAQLLCALLVHQYWRLPAVMEGSAGGSSSDVKDASRLPRWHDAGLPYSEYNQLDVAALSATSPMYREGKAIRSSQSQRDATQMPDTLAHIVHALTNAAQLLVQSHCSSEAAVLGAFSDFMATVHLQQVELTVAARLVRATAAADLGSFSVAMRHIHSVCVGAGLPQPVRGVLGMDSLPGYYSIAAAVAAAATSRAAGAPAPSISPTPAKKPAAGTGALTGGSGSVSGGSFAGSAAAALASGSKDGGGGALSLSAAATVLPASVASLFFFYRDDDSPSSPHNIAAVRAFVLACLPGLAVDSVLSLSSPTSRTMAAAATTSFALPLVGGLLASPALESRYGVCLLRRLCLTVAEVLVRLGTGDLTYLFRSPPSLSSLSRTATGSEGGVAGGGGGRSACAEFVAAAPISTTAAAPGTASGGHRRGSSPAPPSSAGSGSSLASLAFSSAAFPLLATGERPTSACSEACRFALVLLNSLRSVDVRYALVGQPSAAVGSAALGAGEETDNTTSSRATRVSAETNARTRAANVSGGDAGYTGSDPARAAAAASAVMQSFAGEAERGSAAPSAQSVAWLDTLAAISQWAVLLTGEVLAAQGQYNACLQLLTSAIADYNDEQAAVAPSVAGEARQRSISPSPQPTPTAMIQSLRGYGLQGSRGGGGGGSKSGTSLPFNCTYVHWMRVWQLMCRCYCLLRRYAQLENAAGAQGLRLCDAFGETGAQRRAFQLYRLYALTQMGQLKEAAVVAADLQRAAAPFLTLTPEKETDGTLDDGSAAVALLWWQTEQANAGTSPRSSAVSARRLVTQLFKVAVAERGVLPWHPLSPSRPVVVLESPNAHTVVPLCPLSGCAKTRDVWQLHHAMNHYASELQWQMPPSSPSPQPPGGKVSMSAGGSVRNRALLSAPPSTDAPSATVVASTPSAIVLLREALEAVGAQYTTQAHPGQWLESQLLLTRLRARAVCDALNARQRRSNDDDDNTNNSATVEFALDDGAPSITTAGVAAEPSRAVPVLSSRDAALNALPAPVHDVCEELLRTLQLLLQFPVQRHTMLRVVLLDLAAVLSAHIRDVRTRRRRDTKRTAPAAATAAATEEALLPQFEAVVAACTILAGLVTDMERRVRTGADSFRGYLTDPRLASSEAGDTIALLLQAQWPESLCAAVQQTHDNVGQLQSASARMNAHGGGGGGTSPSPSLAAEVISHPFYALPEVQQQFFGASATAAAGASGSVTATGAAANAGNSSSGRSGSGGNRDQGAANVGSGVKRGGGGAAASLQSSSSAAGVATAAAAAASPLASLLSVPALALTFTTLSDEAAAVLALTPVATALEHDTAVQLLTSHLQSLSPPINCTYLCYRDDTRQQLLEAVGAVLIHQQQLQQPHPKGTGSAQRKSSSTVLRRLGGAGGSAQGGASNAGGITALNFTEADVWKALVPPVLLSALPVDLFSAVGPDTLGAPLYNSVAAAAVEVPGHSPPSFVYGKKSGQTFSTAAAAGGDAAGGRAGESTTATWQLFLSVSPLHDAGITEAPVLTSTSSSSAQAALSTDAVLLLPPAHLVAAANFTASGGGVGGSAGSDGGAGVASAQGASMASTGGAAAALGASAGGGGGSSVAFSRGRNTTRLFGAVNSTVAAASTTVAPAHRSSDQDTVMSHAGVSGTVWPPAQTSTSPRAACLVPSTNWAFLDQIQREGLSGAQTRVEENAATTTTTAPVKPTSPAPGIRTHAAGKTTRGGNAATGGASSPSHAATHHTTHESTKTCSPGLVEAAAQVPVTFRWRSVSLEMSDSTVQTLRRHLRAVLRCLHRAGEEDATAETADQADAVLEAAKAEADGGRGENATRSALAAAVSKAQQTLRTHLATAGGAMSSNSNAASGGGVGLGSSGGGGSSAFFASTLPATAGSGGSLAMSVSNASAGAISASTSNNSSSIMRKSAQRVGAANANSSGNNTTDSSLLALAGGAVNENTATHDDLAAAVRARQMAERERQRQQHAEELEEAKASLLRELLEAVVSAAVGFGTAVAVVDEARVELDVRRLMPRCPLTPTMVDFLCDWLGGVSAETVDGDEGGDDADAGYNGSSSGHTSLCFYNAGLHEWMQRVAQYVAEQQQQQQQRSSPNSVLM
ncbi:hypothetical protein ABB37_06950 [Leptomonas pyrrhocoris]|uniref:Uncharacterized protein n=1 Tax=Leptomonas pyrrhocoris TaxID=157538 RepID=A0A0M9FWL3_LEPPY|nr:hypothetical protein ABB37_06950 [Leptomonas pyrrhocoris]KPA77580.1 hypothetical protein ABB37_06950 [Leptomonas pyrrhocoris]|eukprot:XP_015656019.1 hypothetical protein ABB37_06950 [Leptomonas pyrrhocoris]